MTTSGIIRCVSHDAKHPKPVGYTYHTPSYHQVGRAFQQSREPAIIWFRDHPNAPIWRSVKDDAKRGANDYGVLSDPNNYHSIQQDTHDEVQQLKRLREAWLSPPLAGLTSPAGPPVTPPAEGRWGE
jgi:proteasome lid subunit RPN8/RPN11